MDKQEFTLREKDKLSPLKRADNIVERFDENKTLVS